MLEQGLCSESFRKKNGIGKGDLLPPGNLPVGFCGESCLFNVFSLSYFHAVIYICLFTVVSLTTWGVSLVPPGQHPNPHALTVGFVFSRLKFYLLSDNTCCSD